MRTNQMMKAVFGLLVLSGLLIGCNVGEQIAEEAVEAVLGEEVIATSEAFQEAVADEVAALATAEASGDAAAISEAEAAISNEVEVMVEEASEAMEAAENGELTTTSDQNDANSGGDAGMGDDPLPITPAAGLPGSLLGTGDGFDVYMFSADPQQVVRLVVSNAADSDSSIGVDLSQEGGYDRYVTAEPGETVTLAMGYESAISYRLHITKDDILAEQATYTFDLTIEAEDDAGTAADAPGTLAEAMAIEPNISYVGASIGNETGANNNDCYKVTLPTAGGSVLFDVTAPLDQPSESLVSAELYDSAGVLLTSNTAQYGMSVQLAYGVADYEEAEAGEYTVCLSSYSYYSYGMYELMATVAE